MYQVSDITAQAIEADNRWWNAVMRDSSGNELSSKNGDIVSISHSISSSGEDLIIGGIITQNINIELKRDDSRPYNLSQGATFFLSYYVNDLPEEIPMGKYQIISCVTQSNRVRITAKDFFYGIDRPYESDLTYPTTLKQVIREICNDIGISEGVPYEKLYFRKQGTESEYEDAFDANNERIYVKVISDQLIVQEPIQGQTLKEAISILAGNYGMMAMQDRSGALTFVAPSKVKYTVPTSRALEPESSWNTVTISGIACTVDNDTVLVSEDTTIKPRRILSFSNPTLTQNNIDDMSTLYIGLSYTPAKISHKLADPRLDVMDIISYQSFYNGQIYSMPIMSIAYSFDGGLSSNLQSTASSNADKNSSSSGIRKGPVTQHMEKLAREAQDRATEIMEHTVEKITGNQGGYIVIKYNADGKPQEIFVADNEDLDLATEVLRINKSGIAGSTNGIEGPYNVAITTSGIIQAEQILAGILSTVILQSLNYDAEAGTGSRLSLDDGTFSLADGLLKFEDGILKVKNAVFEDGTFRVNSGSTDQSIIQLNYNDPTDGVEAKYVIDCSGATAIFKYQYADTSARYGSDAIDFNYRNQSGYLGVSIASYIPGMIISSDNGTDSYLTEVKDKSIDCTKLDYNTSVALYKTHMDPTELSAVYYNNDGSIKYKSTLTPVFLHFEDTTAQSGIGIKMNGYYAFLFRNGGLHIGSSLWDMHLYATDYIYVYNSASMDFKAGDSGIMLHGYYAFRWYSNSVYCGIDTLPLRLVGSSIYANGSPVAVSSDERVKKDIEDLDDKYLSIIKAIKPKKFKYDDSIALSGRTHTGYIAQDLKKAIEGAKLTTKELAAFVDLNGDGSEYAIRYDELIPLLHGWISELDKRIEKIESRLDSLERGDMNV